MRNAKLRNHLNDSLNLITKNFHKTGKSWKTIFFCLINLFTSLSITIYLRYYNSTLLTIQTLTVLTYTLLTMLYFTILLPYKNKNIQLLALLFFWKTISRNTKLSQNLVFLTCHSISTSIKATRLTPLRQCGVGWWSFGGSRQL